MWVLLLLWPLALGSRLEGGTPTPSVYDEEWSTGRGDGVQRGPWTTPRGPAGCLPRSFPGRLCPNGSNTLELPESSQALLLGWVATGLVPALYGLALLVGLPANGLALWVLATRVPRLPSTLLLMNLAAADLLLALTLPPRITYHLRGQRWPFGEAACRLDTAALYGHMYCSMLLLAAISLAGGGRPGAAPGAAAADLRAAEIGSRAVPRRAAPGRPGLLLAAHLHLPGRGGLPPAPASHAALLRGYPVLAGHRRPALLPRAEADSAGAGLGPGLLRAQQRAAAAALLGPGPGGLGEPVRRLHAQPGVQHPQQLRGPLHLLLRVDRIQGQGAGSVALLGAGLHHGLQGEGQPGDGHQVLIARLTAPPLRRQSNEEGLSWVEWLSRQIRVPREPLMSSYGNRFYAGVIS